MCRSGSTTRTDPGMTGVQNRRLSAREHSPTSSSRDLHGVILTDGLSAAPRGLSMRSVHIPLSVILGAMLLLAGCAGAPESGKSVTPPATTAPPPRPLGAPPPAS